MCLDMALLSSPYGCRYGEAEPYDNMTSEMRSYYEDWIVLVMGGTEEITKVWKIVGVLGSESSGSGSFVRETVCFSFLQTHVLTSDVWLR